MGIIQGLPFNNRFLKRVNPEIVRAKDDSGSSLNHPEIQKLMRQMVDLGIADNLKLWVHNGLVKTRTSGSDTFVPKAYDISGEEDDTTQTTENWQPGLVSLGMEFDGSDDYLQTSYSPRFSPGDAFTWMLWFKTDTAQNGVTMFSARDNTKTGNPLAEFYLYSDKFAAFFRGADGNRKDLEVPVATLNYADNVWHLVTVVVDDGDIWLYMDGTLRDTESDLDMTIDLSGVFLPIGTNNYEGTISRFFTGTLNDIRIFNSALTSTQISAIFNKNKGAYGIT